MKLHFYKNNGIWNCKKGRHIDWFDYSYMIVGKGSTIQEAHTDYILSLFNQNRPVAPIKLYETSPQHWWTEDNLSRYEVTCIN